MYTCTICRLKLRRFIRLQEVSESLEANPLLRVRRDRPRTGSGGELHQQPAAGGALLTTNQGVPISDNQNSLKAAGRGPTLLEDFILREKITHFDHERIPERIVHARGSGAHGFFERHKSMNQVTSAAFLQRDPKTRHPCSRGSRRLPAGPARLTCRATCAALR